MATSTNIAVLIAAAGGAKRMGQPKQLLPWGDTTLLGHAIETAQQLSSAKILVVLGAHFSNIKTSVSNYPVEVLHNQDWERGLGTSIALGVKHLLETAPVVDGLLVMLADQPLVDAPYLKLLAEKFVPGEDQIVVTAYAHQKPGVPALFDRTYFAELARLNDDLGARSVIRSHMEKVLMCPATVHMVDIDTRAEYDALYKANHRS